MLSISTPRLNLVALSEAQLHMALMHPHDLADQLGCDLDVEAIGDASRRAIHVKLDKMEQAPESEHPWFTYWLLVVREEGIGVGLAGFKGAPASDGESEIGYGISSAHQGHGYMTEAVRGLVEWAFQQPECQSICAETLRTNVPSHRVLQKTGFQVYRETQMEIFWRLRKTPLAGETEQDERSSLCDEI